MKKIINRRFLALVIFAIITTTLLMTGIFYRQLKNQAFSDLAVMADLIAESDDMTDTVDELRVTIIEADGTVSYDSEVAAETLENHLNRPEVQQAIEEGTGQIVRVSDTLSKSIFYYTKYLSTGQVLRVGKESSSVFAFFLSTLPVVILAAILLGVVCYFVSKFLTRDIIRPIEDIVEDLDNIKEENIYEELIPFTRKIRAQHEEILSAANMRQEFTANVTHELKTPLAAISGYAELMENGMADAADIPHFAAGIRKSAERLLTLINDIIHLSQLDSGNAEAATLEWVNLAEVAMDTVQMLSVSAQKNNLTLHYDGTNLANLRLGKEWAQELTYNLVENAIRYNRPGGDVSVSVYEENGQIIFRVKDTGIGIDKKDQERIFERFYRVDKSRSKELGGTGLGLAIVKHIADLTQGDLSISSELRKGTTISITWKAAVER